MTEPDPRDAEIAQLKAALAEQAAQAVQRDDQVPDTPQVAFAEGANAADPAQQLPYEAEMDALMEQFRALSEKVAAQETEIARVRGSYAQAIAALGPPAIVTYGKALRQKLVSFRNAHPDVPPGHFDQVIDAVSAVHDAAVKLEAGDGKPADVASLAAAAADAVDRFTGRTHPRRSGKPIDFSALNSDVEALLDEAAKAA